MDKHPCILYFVNILNIRICVEKKLASCSRSTKQKDCPQKIPKLKQKKQQQRQSMFISKQKNLDIKTLRNECSNIDVFSKLQSSFLEKFFKYNLSDYFNQNFISVYENHFLQKIGRGEKQVRQDGMPSLKTEKYLASSLFEVGTQFTVQEMQGKVNKFYRDRSTSLTRNQLPYAFKLKYQAHSAIPNLLKTGELIYIDVKIKADVQKIQQVPEKIFKYFQSYRLHKRDKLSPLQQYLQQYKKQPFTIIVIYFGDSNFQIFNKRGYTEKQIKIMGRYHRLNIYAFYVSKQALLETFKFLNRIDNLEYLNDLVIQFYELKREKNRRKALISRSQREREANVDCGDGDQKNSRDRMFERMYMFIGVFGLVGFGLAIKKLLL